MNKQQKRDAGNNFRRTLRRVLAQFYLRSEYQLFSAESGRIASSTHKHEYFVTITAATIANLEKERSLLLAMNPKNHAYLDDVRRGRAIAVLAVAEGRPVHYAFLFLRNRTRCLLGLPRNAALLAHAYTVEEYRGRGCQGRSVAQRAGVAAEAGYSLVYAETSIDNESSRRGLAKAGMTDRGHLLVVRIFRIFVWRPVRPEGVSAVSICP